MRNKTILTMIALIAAIAAPVVASAQSQEQGQVQPEQEQVQPEPKPPVATPQPRPTDPCIATCAAKGVTPGMPGYGACLRACHKLSMPGREHSSAIPPSSDQLMESRDPPTVFEGGGSMS